MDKPLTQKEINVLLIGDDSLIEQVKEIKTVEQALKAVEYGCMLEFVPKELRTAEVCLEAVRNIQSPGLGNSNALAFVPEALKTAELCAEAVKNNYGALSFVPENLMTAELCLKALEQDGVALLFVPEIFKTAELCLEAVKLDGVALEFVPEELKTAQLCLEAVRNKKNVISLSSFTSTALEYVPEALKTAELCAEAVKNDGWAIKYVPKNLMTAELCLEAVKQNSVVLEYVPEEFKTFEFCVEAIKNAIFVWLTLEHVPEKIKTTELWLEAVKDYTEDKKNWLYVAEEREDENELLFQKTVLKVKDIFRELAGLYRDLDKSKIANIQTSLDELDIKIKTLNDKILKGENLNVNKNSYGLDLLNDLIPYSGLMSRGKKRLISKMSRNKYDDEKISLVNEILENDIDERCKNTAITFIDLLKKTILYKDTEIQQFIDTLIMEIQDI